MDTEALKINDFAKALRTLKVALDQIENGDILVRDATVKRFEYCFELGWKTMKEYVSHRYGVAVFSPKETFRALLTNQCIAPEECEQLLEMADDRNRTVHVYDEIVIAQLAGRIPAYFSLLEKMLHLMKKSI